ncbi:ABC transporter [Kocuria rosea]|uniref:ABC transporter ATP-binding protein n=1 Tax=Kocuria rosea TaxID=1275 RepID=UPI000D658A04|nr:ABC transporter ATP-binding protein [Kocuria rosea]MEB2525636.1 ABC transporter ATP-binding protein [Kocuria rosea]MEB2619117.1 ABC transporter ATP-binding protein [Kocuria rosea]PWF86896.1 ABC transporter [Kocuria rosea]QCY32066.1 ABC transporter ATP-binding protein [Kocuria rosea]TQN39534.1 sulfonate transport system ATP-binding protein [Kocuria rosea]
MSTSLLGSAPATAPGTAKRAFSVAFERVGKAFPSGRETHYVLQDVDVTARPGEVLAVLGPSGCGKSTLLRAAAGLDTASAGRVLIDGTPVSGIDPRCAVAFQEPRLLPWRSVRENVRLGLPRGLPRDEGDAVIDDLLRLVGLTAHAGHRPRAVSGGMAQRASLARALARNPGVLLLDEPFGALDALTRLQMQDLLLTIHAAQPTTVLLVTHDVDEALQLADRIVVLGRTGPTAPASISTILAVPGERPRDRASEVLAELRVQLLGHLGVDTHHPATR